MNNDRFLTGYVAAQAMPGPLFSFTAYLGATSNHLPNGWLGGIIALVAIYLPSGLLVIGLLPFWSALRQVTAFQAALRGVNAAVVGILLAALYQPIWTSAIHTPVDFALGLGAFALLVIWRWPAWALIILAIAGTSVVSLLT